VTDHHQTSHTDLESTRCSDAKQLHMSFVVQPAMSK